jgi:hypothetical protein
VFDNPYIDKTDEIDPQGEDEYTLRHFQLWLYTHTFDRDSKQNINRMVELLVFADKYWIPLLQNMVLNEILDEVALQRALPDVPQINFVYRHTVPNSGLRHFVLDVVCRRMSSKDALNSDTHDRLTEEALRDVLR